MIEVEKGGGGIVNMWSLNQKISGLGFVKPNIPALKYCRDMEIEAANTFIEFIKGKHKDIKFSECGLFVDETLPFVGNGKTMLKKSHKYYTQCMLQMAVNGTIKIILLSGFRME